VTEAEVERVRLFYSSVDSEVVVCASLADVSVGCVARRPGADRSEEGRGLAGCDSVAGCCWIHLLTGVPVLVLSVGSQRRRRELSLVVADRCTALPLWRDRINCMSAFRHLQAVCDENSAAGSGAALTMRVSGGLTKRLRIDVFSRCAAAELMAAYAALTADPADDLWNMSNESSATAAAHVRTSLLYLLSLSSSSSTALYCLLITVNTAHTTAPPATHPDDPIVDNFLFQRRFTIILLRHNVNDDRTFLQLTVRRIKCRKPHQNQMKTDEVITLFLWQAITLLYLKAV